MITNLYNYFGVIGILSILVWVAALVLLVMSVRRRARPIYCLLALGVAVVGGVLARVNSDRVSSIELDRRDELAAVKKAKIAEEGPDAPKSTASALQFAEGDPEDTMPEYRKKGKQVRSNGKALGEVLGKATTEEEAEKTVKTLREPDLRAANRLDRLNLMIVRLILWFAVLRVVVDYLARLNSTVGGFLSLPIAGTWLEHFSDKKHAVLVMAPAKGRMTPSAYAERVVKTGESFIYFGENDPWQGRDWLPRLAVWRWPLWRFPKLDYGDSEVSINGEYVLDAAWFNRSGAVVLGDENGFPLFDHISELIIRRHEAGAAARNTVHILWDLPQTLSPDMIIPLLQIARETNIKLTVWAYGSVESEFAGLFEECFDDVEPEVIVVE